MPRARGGNGRYTRSQDTAERDAAACRLRTEGRTYDQIAQQLGFADRSNARDAVERALKATVQEPADQVRQLELARLDALWAAAWAVLEREHVVVNSGEIVIDTREGADGQPLLDDAPVLKAVQTLLKVAERRAKLLGLDAPTKIEQGGTVKYVIEGVDLGKLR
jgi:hypothetical protein